MYFWDVHIFVLVTWDGVLLRFACLCIRDLGWMMHLEEGQIQKNGEPCSPAEWTGVTLTWKIFFGNQEKRIQLAQCGPTCEEPVSFSHANVPRAKTFTWRYFYLFTFGSHTGRYIWQDSELEVYLRYLVLEMYFRCTCEMWTCGVFILENPPVLLTNKMVGVEPPIEYNFIWHFLFYLPGDTFTFLGFLHFCLGPLILQISPVIPDCWLS